jgi:hypothetical protein
MTTLTISHPGLKDPTSMAILKDVSQLIRGTKGILFLPYVSTALDVIHICCVSGESVTDPPYDNKLLVFHTPGDLVVIGTPAQWPDGKTNYPNFKQKFIEILSSRLQDFLKGELSIDITPQSGYPRSEARRKPQVELQRCQIQLNIRNNKSVQGKVEIK